MSQGHRSEKRLRQLARRLFFVSASIAFFLLILAFASRPRVTGRVLERSELDNGVLKIRVTSYMERGLLPGAFFSFESCAVGSVDRKEIMTYRGDDPRPIPKDHVRFLGEKIAYVFMGGRYAVTTNGGKEWSLWDLRHAGLKWGRCDYGFLEDVSITSNGSGTMRLGGPCYDHPLKTSDYGRSWLPPGGN